MRNLLSIVCAIFIVSNLYAQRVAVLDFNAGSGVSQADVDGISAIFNTYFTPNGYTLVERIQIDRVIDEQNLQRGQITEEQMVRIGEILNVSMVVVGKINITLGQYNVDVQAVNVESGTIAGKTGATWTPNSSYREMMQSIATDLAEQISIKPIEVIHEEKNTVRKRNEVEVVLGYLKVYPTELGVFPGAPSTVIAQINRQHLYDYDTWRIPSDEELALLRANNYLSDSVYISSSKMRSEGVVLLVTDDLETYSQKQDRLRHEATGIYVDNATQNNTQTAQTYIPHKEIIKVDKMARFTIMNDVDFAFGEGLVIGSPTLIVGSTIKNKVFVGIGSSVIMDYNNDNIAIPIYVSSRLYLTNNTAIRPYFSLSVGGEVYNGGWYINPSIGIDIPISKKFGLYLSAGYEGVTDYSYHDYGYYDYYDPGFASYINLKLGIRFQ